MRLNFVIMALMVFTAQIQAQEVLLSSSRTPKPTWVDKPDTSVLVGDYYYYYYYAKGEANSESKAKSMAVKAIITQIAMLEGCSITVSDIVETFQQQEGTSFKINEKYYSISKSTCKNISTKGYREPDFYLETWRRGDSTFYHYYLCASMPGPKLIKPNKAMTYSIFPGGGQIYKREYGKPIPIWIVLGASAGGTFHLSNRAVYWRDVADGFPSNKTLRDEYKRYQRTNAIGAIGCGVAAAGLYIWNLYDAHHHENKRIRFTKAHFKLQPYYAANHGGLMLSYSLQPQK